MTDHADRSLAPSAPHPLLQPLPGLVLAAGLALVGFLVAGLVGSVLLSPMVVALVIGISARNSVGVPAMFQPGLALALRPVLRTGIVLLGFRVTFDQLAEVGLTGLAVVAAGLLATFVFTKAAGRLLGVDRSLAELIAAGTSVCGASAVLATNTVTRGSDEDVAYSIACVTIFGSIAMISYPFLASALGFDAQTYGLWAGASIHEVAQAVGAGFANGDVSGEAATVAKLSRVAMLAPLILGLGLLSRRGNGGETTAKAPVPWFVLGFVAAVAVNSVVPLPDALVSGFQLASAFMLTMALGAMGLETHVRRLRLKGGRPLLLGALAAVFMSTITALMISAL